MRRTLATALLALSAIAAGVSPAAADLPADSIVVNGGFEQPNISSPNYALLGDIPGWSRHNDCPIELQDRIVGDPFEGDQHIELDSTCSGGVVQVLATEPGRRYRIRYAYSPRRPESYFAGSGDADNNVLHVLWDGSLAEQRSRANTTANSDWSAHEFSAVASGTSTKLAFVDGGTRSDSFGVFIDAVSVIPEAPPCPDPGVSVDDVSLPEPDSGDVASATFTLSLSAPPCGGPASVQVATADQTAGAGSDYSAISPPQTVTFDTGVTSRTVTVPVIGDNLFEPDETFLLELTDGVALNIADSGGVGTILNDDPQNQAPDCSSVAASPGALWPPNHKLQTVTLVGATDPDGDTVTIAITGVTQDEPLEGTGDGDTSPDAAPGLTASSVQLRAERAGDRDGRVYRIDFAGTDPGGGACTGTATVGVPHDRSGGAAVDSGDSHNSFG